jgi:hypothetical protein
MTTKITRNDDSTYRVMTDVVLSDHTLQHDDSMALVGNELQPVYERGSIRIRAFHLRLGAISKAAVLKLQPGQTAELVS